MIKSRTIASAVSAFMLAFPAMAQDSITVQAWGTTWDMGLRTIADNFTAATGIQVVSVPQTSSTEGLVRIQAMKPNPTVDVWFTTASVAARAETDLELFSPIDGAALTNAPDLINGAATPFWVGAYYYPLSIVYRPDMVDGPITEWSDLWDEKFSGMLAAPPVEMYQARLLLVASLINGGSIDDVEPGFAALKELSPNVATWYQSDSAARSALAIGEVSVLVAPPALAKGVSDDGIAVEIVSPNPTPVMFDVMMLVNTPKKELGQQFIDYVVSAESQALLAVEQNVGPVNTGADVPPDVVAAMPKPEDQVAFDEQKINAGVAGWTERFIAEVVN